MHLCEPTFATSCGRRGVRGGGGGQGVETGEPCHVFMLTNELITQPLIYLNLCHFTGMLEQWNACRLWVISWQLKANYYSSNSSTHQALNHKCCSLSICLSVNLLSWNGTTGWNLLTEREQVDLNILEFISLMIWLLMHFDHILLIACMFECISFAKWKIVLTFFSRHIKSVPSLQQKTVALCVTVW